MSRVNRAILLQVTGLLIAAGLVIWLSRHSALLEYIGIAQLKVASMGKLAAVLYPLLYALCNVLLLPGGTLALGSGLFFGLWWGFTLNVAGSTVGAAVAIALSRWALRGWLSKRLLRHRKWNALDEAIGREGWKIIFLSQVHPLAPSSLLNYLYGLTRVPFRTCLLWVAIGQAPGAFLYAYLGTLAQLGIRLLRGQTHPRLIEYVIWIGGLLLTVVVTTLLGRVALRLLEEAEAKATRPTVPPVDSRTLPLPVSPESPLDPLPAAKAIEHAL